MDGIRKIKSKVLLREWAQMILRYQQYTTILSEYLYLEEFSTLSELTIKGKRIALIQLMNYLGDVVCDMFLKTNTSVRLRVILFQRLKSP